MNFFLTGVTGFLAGELLVTLLRRPEVKKVFCLIRAEDVNSARARLKRVLDFHGDFFDEKRVIPILGDLSNENLFKELMANDIIRSTNIVIHAAANTSFSPAYKEDIRRVNIEGASKVFEWAATLPELENFVYIGTSWIYGSEQSHRVVFEDESPDISKKQLVEYCRSKTIGEINVRKTIPADKLLVVRPSIIMGDSRNWTPRSYVILWALAAFDLMRLIGVNPDAACDVIPIDYASNSIVDLIFSRRHYNVYHISAGVKSSTTMGQLINAIYIPDRPPYQFIDNEMVKQLKLFAKKKLPETSSLKKYQGHLDYLKQAFGENGNLRKVLGAVDYYFQFVNLGLVFDNSRLIQDSSVGYPEYAHVYMGRNKMQLRKIDVMEGSVNP